MSIQISRDMASGINQAADRHNTLIYLVNNVLVKGGCLDGGTTGDYGLIPKCPKPILFKQGAEKLADAFGLRIFLEKTEQILERDFVHYEFLATVYRESIVLTTHTGACNTDEKGISKTLEKQGQIARGYAHNIACRAEKRAYVGGVIKALAATQYFSWDQEAYDLLPTDQPFEGITVEITSEIPTQDSIRNLAREICRATGHTTQQLQKIASAANLPTSSSEMTWDQAIALQKAALIHWLKTRYLGITEEKAIALLESLPAGTPATTIAILKSQMAEWQP